MSNHPSLRPTWTLAGNLQTVLLGLASGGVCLAAASPRRRCALTAPFQPCRPATAAASRGASAVCFCGTFPRVSPGRRYRPPCPVMSGLSSKAIASAAARSAGTVAEGMVIDQEVVRAAEETDMSMYDVIYIDAQGTETPVAQHARRPQGRGGRSRGEAAAERGAAGWSSPARRSCRTASASSPCRPPKPPSPSLHAASPAASR